MTAPVTAADSIPDGTVGHLTIRATYRAAKPGDSPASYEVEAPVVAAGL